MVQNQECIDACNSLLRGELSAVETYTQAIAKFEGDPARAQLERIRDEHQQTASILRDHLIAMDARPAESSGAWGTFAQAVEGTAKIFGESPALAALQQGEEHGVREYQDALEDPDVMEEIKAQIRSTLLPRLTAHISQLQALRAK